MLDRTVVGVLVIFTFQKSFVNSFPDLTPEAITVYRNPEFFKNLPYYYNEGTPTKTSQEEEADENYKYPGETTKPNKSGDSPGLEVTYDNSPEFHHDPRDVAATPVRPSRRRGPYGPVQGGQNASEENTTENYEESLPESFTESSEKSSDENLKENTEDDADDNYTRNSYEGSGGNLEEEPEENYTRSSGESSGANSEDSENNYSGNSQENTGENLEEDAEDNDSRNSHENSGANVEDEAEIHNPEDSNEHFNRNVHTDEDVSEENAEKTANYNDEDVSEERTSEEEAREGAHQERNQDYNSAEYSEEQSPTTSPYVASDDEVEAETEATLSIEPPDPEKILEVPKSIYNQPYPFNATYPILYDNWKHYNYPKIASKNFVPLHGADASSNVPSDIRNDDDEEEADSFENIDTNNMGTDTKRIYKKLLRHKKLKPSVLFKYHSKPKLKKLKLKLKNDNHDSWFDMHPFNF